MAIQQVIFKINNEEYGIDVSKVNGIEKCQQIMRVPNTPKYIEGIINLRGEVLPIYSLSTRFNFPKKEIDLDSKIIIIKTNELYIGLLVDFVGEIVYIDEKNVLETPILIRGKDRRYIKNIAKHEDRMIILLDVDLIISENEYEEINEILEKNS